MHPSIEIEKKWGRWARRREGRGLFEIGAVLDSIPETGLDGISTKKVA